MITNHTLATDKSCDSVDLSNDYEKQNPNHRKQTSSNKQSHKKKVAILHPQPTPTTMNHYAPLENLQEQLRTSHLQNLVQETEEVELKPK